MDLRRVAALEQRLRIVVLCFSNCNVSCTTEQLTVEVDGWAGLVGLDSFYSVIGLRILVFVN